MMQMNLLTEGIMLRPIFLSFSRSLLVLIASVGFASGCAEGPGAATSPPSFIGHWEDSDPMNLIRATGKNTFHAWVIEPDHTVHYFTSEALADQSSDGDRVHRHTVGRIEKDSDREASLVLNDGFLYKLERASKSDEDLAEMFKNSPKFLVHDDRSMTLTYLVHGQTHRTLLRRHGLHDGPARIKEHHDLMSVRHVVHRDFVQKNVGAKFSLGLQTEVLKDGSGRILETFEILPRDVPDAFEGRDRRGRMMEKLNAKSIKILNERDVQVNDRKVVQFRIAVERLGDSHRTILALHDDASPGSSHIIFSGRVLDSQNGNLVVESNDQVLYDDLGTTTRLQRILKFVRSGL
jgi:hypothetical protein